ncbi:unnamed protein product [Auanema sp. JU1783]|nr:unnamed protein product [Auanema sp. JU1783]
MSSFLDKIRVPKFTKNNLGNSSDLGAANNGVSGNAKDNEELVEDSVSLAYSLDRLLNDSSALSFFIHFLEFCDKLSLIKFWMHVEGFKASFCDSSVDVAQSLSVIDANNIYERYIEETAFSSLSLPQKIVKQTKENVMKRPLSITCFDQAQSFVKSLFHLRYFEEFLSSVFYKKHELEVLSNGCTLSDVLHIQPLLQSFMEVLETDLERERIQFMIACESFENDYCELSPEEATKDALALYERFFSMQSPNPIDVGDRRRVAIESAICSDTGKPELTAFKAAYNCVYSELQKKYLNSFVSSAVFTSYVEDLRSQIENTVEFPRHVKTRSKNGSTGSSDSLPSTFRKHCQLLEQVQTSSQTNSPRSPRTTNLAEIDNMGRYRPLYDYSFMQDNRSPNKLKLKLKQYLDKSSMREEEVAEEVAKSIIADVQSMVEAGKKGEFL